jgi:hypothetical protein
MINSTLLKIIKLFYGEAFNKKNTLSQRFMRIVTRTPLKYFFYKINVYFNVNKTLTKDQTEIFEEPILIDEANKELKKFGIFSKFKIKDEIISKIKLKIQNKEFLINRSSDKLTYENRTSDTYIMRYHNPHLEISEVKQIALNTSILSLVEKYLGCNPIIQSTQIWWTFPYLNSKKLPENPPGNEYGYHYDVDDYKFLKLFVYLTNVESDCGPHIYIENSGKKKFSEYLDRRISEELIEKNYKNRIRILTGKCGQGFIEDASFYHKGTNPLNKQGRCLLQIIYSMNKW